jgi:hypothetical protein
MTCLGILVFDGGIWKAKDAIKRSCEYNAAGANVEAGGLSKVTVSTGPTKAIAKTP